MSSVPPRLPNPALSRRGLFAAAALTAAAPAVAMALPASAASAHGAGEPGRLVDKGLAEPVNRAFGYLDTVQDAYVTGATPRLLQSYNNESGLMTTAFVYDNALAVIAYLSRPTAANVARAKLIGDAFLWIQGNDEAHSDGRVRQAYAAGPMLFYGWWPYFPGLVREDGKAAFLWPFGFSGSAVGDVAWVALSLTHLYAHTRQRKYLDGAVAASEWIVNTAVSPYAYGGYHGGVQGDGVTPQRWCSTEHNIDVYGLFTLLARYTKDRAWARRADVAGDFVRRMFNKRGGYYWTGTLGSNPADDPNLINTAILPEDVNTWAYLSLGDRAHAGAIDWTARSLAVTDTPAAPNSQLPAGVTVSGVTFSDMAKTLTGPVPNGTGNNNQSAVWLEGNGHMAAALLARDAHGDRRRAVEYLRQVVVAQTSLGGGQTVGLTSDPADGRLSNPGDGGTWTGTPLPAGGGVVSASSAFDTGFGFGYFQRQHVGATSWFLIAATGTNPYRV
ncbi:hypothetical protein GCM10009682_44050 [Luedemannella flava]|uniref:Tat pathway signal sequence domain protein n=1 Tax=Luedemannella flava TaxID=349316 RepID=A0ABP4YNS0_9ACTN